ncbi:hypothetical protein HKX48_006189 [Thoreauomyces humboldtii]|nr:hypothetical protein HKX48_006189 [Thoreauomyces humboldtii]
MQNSSHIVRIEDYLARLQALIWLFLDDAQPQELRKASGRDRIHSGSRSRPPQRERPSVPKSDYSPVPSRRRSSVGRQNVSPHPVNSSGYRVVKSRPLQSPLPQPISRRAPAKTHSRDSRTSSASPFRRFDPTTYVQERNRKMDERRARSRERSAHSPSSRTGSVRSAASGTSADDHWRNPQRSRIRSMDRPSHSAPKAASRDRVLEHDRPPYLSKLKGSLPRKAKARRKEQRPPIEDSVDGDNEDAYASSVASDWDTHHGSGLNTDTVEIDRRLAKLYDSIVNVR